MLLAFFLLRINGKNKTMYFRMQEANLYTMNWHFFLLEIVYTYTHLTQVSDTHYRIIAIYASHAV